MGIAGLNAGADGGHQAKATKAPAEKDGVVDRSSAGIQHHGRAAQIPPFGKFVEILRTVRRYDSDCADPTAAMRLTFYPAELHRQFTLFEGLSRICQVAKRRNHARHGNTQSGSGENGQAAEAKSDDFQFGPFPASTKRPRRFFKQYDSGWPALQSVNAVD